MGTYPVRAVQTGDEVQLHAVSGKGRAQAAVQHRLTIITTQGQNPRIQCWCGASLTLDYFLDNGGCAAMTRRLSAFLDEHEECEATA